MQTYDEMVDSGVEWLGDVPSTWVVLRGKFNYANKKEINKGMVESQRLALTLKGVIDRKDGDDVGLNPESLESYQIFEKNDLVFKLIDLENKATSRVGLTPKRGIMSPAYIRLTPRNGDTVAKYFYYYYFSLYLTYVYNNIAGEGVRANIGAKELLDITTPVPPVSIQQKIADFLDQETAKIDNLIAKQERLLELLEEKRRATITRAVTRGLDPSVELKEPNIPCLGQVPQHWKLGKIYQYCTTGSGTTPNSNLGDWYTDTESGTPWVTTGELRESLIMTTKVKVTEVAIQKHSALKVYPAGTLLIAMYGATIGRLGTLGVSACTNQACCALKPSESLLNKYLYYYLLGMREQLLFLSSGGGQPNISKEKIDSFPLLLPDRTEQLEIANWLDSQEDKVDKLKQKIQTQITILRERRTSLISHAVTGKIKV